MNKKTFLVALAVALAVLVLTLSHVNAGDPGGGGIGGIIRVLL